MEDLERQQTELAVRRLEACRFTIGVVYSELHLPDNVDLRADLLISAENLLAEVATLTLQLRDMTWPSNDPIQLGNEKD